MVAIYSTFLSRAWDQMVYDVGLHGLPVVFCIDRAGITGDDGPSHHGLYDLALLTKVPGLTLFAPSSYEEMTVMLEEAMRITSGPVALRWPKTVARHVMPGAVGSGRSARRVRVGDDVCILALGKMVEAAEEAAELLDTRDVHATVWDIRTIPADPKMLADAAPSPARRHRRGRHRRRRRGRTARGPARWVGDGHAAPPVVALGTPSAYIPHGKPAALLANLGLDGPGIAATVAKLLEDR